jgi:hypothetical protein
LKQKLAEPPSCVNVQQSLKWLPAFAQSAFVAQSHVVWVPEQLRVLPMSVGHPIAEVLAAVHVEVIVPSVQLGIVPPVICTVVQQTGVLPEQSLGFMHRALVAPELDPLPPPDELPETAPEDPPEDPPAEPPELLPEEPPITPELDPLPPLPELDPLPPPEDPPLLELPPPDELPHPRTLLPPIPMTARTRHEM